MRQEGESSSDGERRIVTVGGVGCSIKKDSTVVEPEKENLTVVEMEVERNELEGGITQAQGESRYGEVYVRRKKHNEEVVPTVPLVPSLLLLPILTFETPTPSTSDLKYTCDIIHLSTPTIPLLVRQTPRDIVKFVSYSHISHIYGAFITSLDSLYP
jgi:hypothetical protein